MATTLEVLTASQVAMLLNPPMVNLQNSSFNVTSGGTYIPITYTTQLSKSGNITWSSGTNPSRITAVVPGTYQVSGSVTWPGTLGVTDARGQIEVNGAATNIRLSITRGSAGNAGSSVSGLVVLNAGDYVELAVNQGSGSTTAVIAVFGVNFVGLATS